MTTLYKGKGDSLAFGALRDKTLYFYRIMGRRIRIGVVIDEFQFDFMPGRGTVYAIFIMTTAKARTENLYFGFLYTWRKLLTGSL